MFGRLLVEIKGEGFLMSRIKGMTREEAMMSTDSQQKEKIKTPFAKVIVDGRGANSYFSILYFDPTDKDFHIGYSSYYLDYVFNWLDEEFEIIENGNFSLTALRGPTREMVERMRGEWRECFEDWRKQIEGDQCSKCGFQHYGTSINHYHFCPACGAPMTDEAVDMMLERWKEALGDET